MNPSDVSAGYIGGWLSIHQFLFLVVLLNIFLKKDMESWYAFIDLFDCIDSDKSINKNEWPVKPNQLI